MKFFKLFLLRTRPTDTGAPDPRESSIHLLTLPTFSTTPPANNRIRIDGDGTEWWLVWR